MLSNKKIISIFSLLLLVGVALGNISKVYAATFEESVVGLINIERQKQNLTPLNYSEKLFNASLAHNNTMYSCAKTSGGTCLLHTVTSLNEPTLLNRIKATGYNPQAVAENIAWGYTTPSSVVSGWMNSSGHRANILGNYKDIGCDYLNALNGSYKGMYWTCDFGKSFTTSTSSPTPIQLPTATSTPKPTVTLAPTIKPTATPAPTIKLAPSPTPGVTQAPTPGSKAWWCFYAPGSIFCP